MAVHSVVSEFCNGISSDIDAAVVEYLTGVIDDACNDECADMSGIEEVVQGFLPDITKLSQQERHERLWTLLTKVHTRAWSNRDTVYIISIRLSNSVPGQRSSPQWQPLQGCRCPAEAGMLRPVGRLSSAGDVTRPGENAAAERRWRQPQ